MRDVAARDGCGWRAARYKRRSCRCRRQNAQHVAVIGMCNLYSLTKGQQAIRELARAMRDRTGNLLLMPGVYPDYRAPVVRNQPHGRELILARWGMPSPKTALKTRNVVRDYAVVLDPSTLERIDVADCMHALAGASSLFILVRQVIVVEPVIRAKAFVFIHCVVVVSAFVIVMSSSASGLASDLTLLFEHPA
jgi:hypothetical protein